MEAEAQTAQNKGIQNPILPEKNQTDDQYNSAVEYALDAIGNKRGKMSPVSSQVSIIIATHNRQSIDIATKMMERLNIPRNHPNIHFAQIMGLCDNLGHALGNAGYNAHKLVLFGLFSDLFPWLLRRLDESRDTLGATTAELPAVGQEIRRRLVGRYGSYM